MGCFGDMETTKTQTNSLPGYLESAAQSNVSNATNIASRPFVPYTGEMTAPLTQNQQDAFGLIKSIAGTSNPYLSDIENLYKTFSSTAGVTPASILGGDKTVGNTTIQDYMSPYIAAALQPQLDELARTGTAQRKSLDASATMDGAFGDARSGVALANQFRDEAKTRAGVVGQGYQSAFDRAASLRQGDIATDTDAQKTNLNLALQRAISGGKALSDLDASTVDRGLKTAGALAEAGKTEQQTNQAADTAKMQEFLRGQGWDQQQISWLTSVLAGTPHGSTSTVQEPNNSGWGILGSLIGTGASLLKLSDRRLKTDISVIGETYDHLPIYRFKYVGSDEWQIGLMAQDVEEVMPAAVVDVNGVKAIDLRLATQAAADMGADV
jgi:hypothetical protein